MFKMGCSMARKILASSSSSQQQQQQQAGSYQSEPSQPRNKTEEINDFSKLEQDPRIPLNVRQIFKITKSWKAIARTMSKTGTAMFLNLFEQNEDLFYLFDRFQHLKGRELHESMELREHAATVMSTLDQSINSLSDYDNFVTYLHSIGELHRKVPGFKREHFWKIEQPFMRAIKQTLDERCNETIEEIYKIAIKLIIETIAEGYGQDVGTPTEGRHSGGNDRAAGPGTSGARPEATPGDESGSHGGSAAAKSSRGEQQSGPASGGLSSRSVGKTKTSKQLEQALDDLKQALDSKGRSCASTCASTDLQQEQRQVQHSYNLEQSESRPRQSHDIADRPCNLHHNGVLVKGSSGEHLRQVCCAKSDNQEPKDYKHDYFESDRFGSAWPMETFIGTNVVDDEHDDDLMCHRHQLSPRSAVGATMDGPADELGSGLKGSLTIQSGAPKQPGESALRPVSNATSPCSTGLSLAPSYAWPEYNRAQTITCGRVKVAPRLLTDSGGSQRRQLNQGQASRCPWLGDQGGSSARVGPTKQMPPDYCLVAANTEQTHQSIGAGNQADAELAKLGKTTGLIAQESSLDVDSSAELASRPGKAESEQNVNGHGGHHELDHQSRLRNPSLPLHESLFDQARVERRPRTSRSDQIRSPLMDSTMIAHYDRSSEDNLAQLIKALMFAIAPLDQTSDATRPRAVQPALVVAAE